MTPTPAFVQLAGVQEPFAPASGFNVPVTNVTSGNTLVVVVANQSGAGITITGVTDANGNTYSPCTGASVNAAPGGTQTQMAMFFAKGVKGGSFNVNPAWTGTASAVAVYVFELINANAYDVGSGGNGTNATADSGAFTTSEQAIIIAATINTASGLSAGTGYTLIQITASYADVLEYKVAAAGSQDAQANLNGAQNWGMVAGAFFFTAPADADYQDYVRLSQDTLYHTGAMFQVGGSTATWLSAGFSNSAGLAVVAANPTTTQSLWLPQSVTQDTLAVLANISTTAVSAGTTQVSGGTVILSNSNNVSFGLNGSTLTASARAIVLAAGTQTATSGTVVMSNSNGFTFGMSGSSRVTAVYGGFSSWSNGPPSATMGISQAFLSLQPIVVERALTVTNVDLLLSISGNVSSSGGYSRSGGLYTLNGNSLSLASSGSTAVTWTSGTLVTASNMIGAQSGLQYQSMSVASWAMTPGLYVYAHWLSTINSPNVTQQGPQAGISIGTGLGSQVTGPFPGFSTSSVAALPASIGLTNTTGYIRTGSSVWNQPWMLMQGT